MIIMGFPCIGKSTLARSKKGRFIDLESSLFKIDGKETDWDQYCAIAHDLSEQGYCVFVSTHAQVQMKLVEKYLISSDDGELCVCYPSTDCKFKWIKRLHKRYQDTGDPKDQRALNYMNINYDEAVSNLDRLVTRLAPLGLRSVVIQREDIEPFKPLEDILGDVVKDYMN